MTNIYFTLPFCHDQVSHLFVIAEIAQWLHISVIWPYLGWTLCECVISLSARLFLGVANDSVMC